MADPNPSRDPLVANVDVTVVKPLQKTAHVESIEPSFVDVSFADLYVPVMFAYRLASNTNEAYSQALKRIKDGLQKVLVPYFTFAGRWIPNGGSRERSLLCNDAGVPFIEAFVDQNMDDVMQFNLEFDAIPELHGYGSVGMDFKVLMQPMPAGGQPPAFAQVTRFKCGGLVVAVNFNHMHTDLNGFCTFMTAWSEVSRGNAVKEEDYDRKQVHVPALANIDQEVQDRMDGREEDSYATRSWVMKSWEVSASAIKSVKQEAKEVKDGPGFVSTQDCIAAHVLCGMARIPPSVIRGKEPRITIAAEGRRRFFDPPLSKEYTGNCISPVLPARVPGKELAEMPVASVACGIRQQLESIKTEEWMGEKRWKAFFGEFASGDSVVISITSAFKTPMYEIDFGFGKPVFARRVSALWNYSRPDLFIGTAAIAAPAPSDSSSCVAVLSVFGLPEVLQALESDPIFLSLFAPQ
ncbi:unnamed protein product [Calypogeia fissa]